MGALIISHSALIIIARLMSAPALILIMANKERVNCLVCDGTLRRLEQHTHDEHVPIGFVCTRCRRFYTKDLIPLIPVTTLIDKDPVLKDYPGRAEVYKAVIKAFDVPIEIGRPDAIERAQNKMLEILSPFQRQDESKKKLVKDLEKEGDSILNDSVR